MRNFFRFIGRLPLPGKFYVRKQFYKFHMSDDDEEREDAYKKLTHTLSVYAQGHGWGVVPWGINSYVLYKNSPPASLFIGAIALGLLVVTLANIRLKQSVTHDYKHGIRKTLTGNPKCTKFEENLSIVVVVSLILTAIFATTYALFFC